MTADKKRRFLNDRPPKNDTELHFQIHTVVEELAEVIRSCSPPYHIALFSPWGTGKSTVVEALVRAMAPKDTFCEICGQPLGKFKSGIRVAQVDAWKYRNDSMRRRLLLEAAKAVDQSLVADLHKQLYKPLSNVTVLFDFDWHALIRGRGWRRVGRTVLARLLDILTYLIVIATITATMTYVRSWGDGLSPILTTRFWYQWAGDVARGGAGSVAAMTLVTYVLTVLGRQYVRRGGQAEMAGIEQFEERFHGALQQLRRDERLLVVVDELDRCSPQQVLEILETVRTFMNEDKCVFLVACDRDVLERAVVAQAESHGRTASVYLEKLFELTISLPAVMHPNMVEFAKMVLTEALGSAESDRIQESGALDLLIWSEVRTPRKVKRLVNDFLVRRDLAISRAEELGRNLPVLAKLTVLSQDFPAFTRQLFDEPELLTWMEMVRSGRVSELDPHAVQVCSTWYEWDKYGTLNHRRPSPEAELLVAFLGESRNCLPEGSLVRSHQYLTSDAVPVDSGLLRHIQSLAASAQGDRLVDEVGRSNSHDEIIAYLVQLFREAKGVRRDNLLLSLLHVSRFASPGNRGTKAAAHVLAEVAPFLTQEQFREVSPLSVLPYIGDMSDSVARGHWARRIEKWAQVDSTRLAEVFAAGRMELLPWDEEGVSHYFKHLLWDWLCTETGRSSLLTRWDDLLALPSLERELYAALFLHIGSLMVGEAPGARSFALTLYRRLVSRIPISEVPRRFSGFSALLRTLLDASAGRSTGWLLGHATDMTEMLPPDDAARVLLGVVSRASLCPRDRIADLLWNVELRVQQHALTSADFQQELWRQIAFLLRSQKLFDPSWAFMVQIWPTLDGQARQALQRELLSCPNANLTTIQLREIAVWLRQNSGAVLPVERVAFYDNIASAINIGPDAVAKLFSVFLDPETAPFDVPSQSKVKLLAGLTEATFRADRPSNQVELLNLLLRNRAGLPLNSVGNLAATITEKYLLGSSTKQFRQAVAALAQWGQLLPTYTQEQREQLLHLVEAVIERMGELKNPTATCYRLVRNLVTWTPTSPTIWRVLAAEALSRPDEVYVTLDCMASSSSKPPEAAFVRFAAAPEYRQLLEWVYSRSRYIPLISEIIALPWPEPVALLQHIRTEHEGLASFLAETLTDMIESGKVKAESGLPVLAVLWPTVDIPVNIQSLELLATLAQRGEGSEVIKILPEFLKGGAKWLPGPTRIRLSTALQEWGAGQGEQVYRSVVQVLTKCGIME